MMENLLQGSAARARLRCRRPVANGVHAWLATCGVALIACGGQMAEADDGLGSGGTVSATTSAGGSTGTSTYSSYGATGVGPNTYAPGGAPTTLGSTGWAAKGGSSWALGGSTWATSGAWSTGGVGGTTSYDPSQCPAISPDCSAIYWASDTNCPVCICGNCGAIACPAGSHVETLPNACCPTCITDTTPSCYAGRQEYTTYRELLISGYGSVACKQDADCAVVYEKNRCSTSCGTAVPASMQSMIITSVEDVAKKLCGACDYPPSPSCYPSVIHCIGGACTLVEILL
jgi:hypothetical protein